MTTKQVITPANLGHEFELGATEAHKIHLKVDGTTLVRQADGTLTAAKAPLTIHYWDTVTAPAVARSTVITLPMNSPSRRAYGACWLGDGELWAYGQNVNGTAAGQNGALEHNRTPTAIPHNAMTFGDVPVGRTPHFTRLWANRQGILLLDDQGKLWYRGANHGRQSGIPAAAAGAVLELPTIIDYFVSNNLTVVDAWLGDGDGDDNYASAYAVTDSGALYVWGRNANGQLGIGATIDTATPTLASAGFGGTAVVQIHVSPSNANPHAAALLADGRLMVCGANPFGQLGLGNTTQQNTWVQSYVGAAYVHCSQYVTFVIDAATGKLWCAGSNSSGWFGRGNTTNSTSWVQATSFTGQARLLRANGYHRPSAYVVDTADKLWVAGDNGFAQLGLGSGNTTAQSNYVQLSAAQAPFQGTVKDVQVAGQSGATAYVITTDGELWSVGYNAYGQRALGNRQDDAAYRAKWRQVGLKNPVVTGRIFGVDDSCTIVALDDQGKLRTCGYDSQMINPLGNWSSGLFSIT